MSMTTPFIKIYKDKNVNVSHQRLGQALGVSDGESQRMSRKSVYEF